MLDNIWFNRPTIGWQEKWAILRVLTSGWISTGKLTKQFEKDFLTYLHLNSIKYAQATNSCTAAMHTALLLENIQHGDEVIVPSITFPSTANVVEHVGAKPIFVDVDPTTLNLDLEDVDRKITEKTKAIIPVSLYGHPYDVSELSFLAKDKNIKVFLFLKDFLRSGLKGNSGL